MCCSVLSAAIKALIVAASRTCGGSVFHAEAARRENVCCDALKLHLHKCRSPLSAARVHLADMLSRRVNISRIAVDESAYECQRAKSFDKVTTLYQSLDL